MLGPTILEDVQSSADNDGTPINVTTVRDLAGGGFLAEQRNELEVIEVLGERHRRDGELVFDRARLLLVDPGREQVGHGSCWRLTAVAMISLRQPSCHRAEARAYCHGCGSVLLTWSDRWIEDVLIGGTGTGKTHLAIAIDRSGIRIHPS